MSLSTFMVFIGKMGLLMFGVLVIALLTPKMASFVDKRREKNPDPYDGVPNPARVQDSDTSKDENSAEEESCGDDTENNS